MGDYVALRPFRSADGRDFETGAAVTMTPRQAKYLLLTGKLAPAVAAVAKAKTQKAAKANTKKE